jgi:hypothetical protein
MGRLVSPAKREATYIGSGTRETRDAMTRLVLAKFAEFSAARPLVSPV